MNLIQKQTQEKLDALNDLKIYYRALRICKWYQFARKEKYKLLIDLTKKLNEV